ncbi:hypothetical protein GCM10009745_51060 [Kribbella yunnanensis]|uniref:DUF3592 domain-containing protein n=1 Tax=Kribbella yunnanensis TaxID=190194 RepID=A0ABN2I4C2_9ACTN
MTINRRVIAASVAALVFLVVGLVQVADLYWLRHRGEVVTATVGEVQHSRRSTDKIKVTYVTRDGQAVVAKTANYHDAEPGQKLDVRYDRKKPTRMQAADWSLSYTRPLLLYGGVGAFLILLAVLDLRLNLLGRLRGAATR